MDDHEVERITEMIYGIDVTKDQMKYIRTKFNNIINNKDNLYIRDKSQSNNFVEGLCSMIRDEVKYMKKIRDLQKDTSEVVKQSDWDYISNKYQDVLLEIKGVKDECNQRIRQVENEYYMKLKGDLLETKPHQDLINKYIEMDRNNIDLENKLHRSEQINKELKQSKEDLYDQISKLSENTDTEKIKKKIEKEVSKNEDDTKKQLQKQVNNLKKLLKLEQEKNMLLINDY